LVDKGTFSRIVTSYLYLYIVLILFLNNFESFKQEILWIGGPVLALLFAAYYLFRPMSIPKELKMYFIFVLYTATGFFYVSDVDLMFDYWKLIVSILIFISCISISFYLSANLLNLLLFLWLACALVCIYSIYVGDLSGFFSGQVQFRPEGGFIKNPNGLANYARIGILSSILVLSSKLGTRFIRLILLTYIPLATILIVVTASRGAFVNLIIIYGLVALIFLKQNSGSYIHIAITFILIGVFGYFLYDEYFASSFLSERLTRIEVSSSTAGVDTNEMRFKLLVIAIDLFRESFTNAFFGIGLNQFRMHSGGLISHSEYSDIIVTTGLLGAYLYYSMYYFLWRNFSTLKSFANSSEIRFYQICQIVIISELLYGFVNPNFLTIIEMVLIFILVGFANIELKRLKMAFRKRSCDLHYD